MQYKISIDTITPREDSDYPRLTTVYEQTIEALDVEAVIKAVNKIA